MVERPALTREVKGSTPLRPASNTYFARCKVLFTRRGVRPNYERGSTMIVDWWVDVEDETPSACMTGRADCDEMTEADWDRYGAEFERRYNAHAESVRGSSPRRVSRACGKRRGRYYYDEEDGIGRLLPTEEEIVYYRKSLMPDPVEVISSMIRPHEDTMASFFLDSQW